MATLPLQLSQASGVPFYRQVVDQVRELISSGQLAPGDRLPSVRDLAKTLLVSLITVRRAYSDLESDGLIVRRQGQGTFVSEHVPTTADAPSTEELEAAVTKALRTGLTPEQITRLVQSTLEAHDA